MKGDDSISSILYDFYDEKGTYSTKKALRLAPSAKRVIRFLKHVSRLGCLIARAVLEIEIHALHL